MESIQDLRTRLRQLSYPREFRIKVFSGEFWTAALGTVLAQTLESARKVDQDSRKIQDAPIPPKTARGVGKEFIVSLCNDVFRLRRNVKLLLEAGTQGHMVRGIGMALDNVDRLFAKNGIEYKDLAGHSYDPDWLAFELLSEPEESPDTQVETIKMCERPMVTLNGELIQAAKGIVIRPAKHAEVK